MASQNTCRACSRLLSSCTPLAHSTRNLRPDSSFRIPSQARRNFAAAQDRSYHTSRALAAKAAPAVAREGTDGQGPAHGGRGLRVSIAKELRKRAPLMTETYVAYGATQQLFKECARHGDYTIPQVNEKGAEIPVNADGAHTGVGSGWWYDTLGLTPTFNVWAQIAFIHMYMLHVRMRMFPVTHASVWQQHLINHAFYQAEDRLVIWHQVHSNALRQRYLKDTFSQWRAVILSYDQALVKGDAMLAAALWRNLFNAKDDVDYQKLAEIVGYMRRELRRLDLASDDEVARGDWEFGANPGFEAPNVMLQSRLMKEGERL